MVKSTNQTEAEAETKTNDELISDLNYVSCTFNRDVLFSLVIMNDEEEAVALKQWNKLGNLTATDVSENYGDSVQAWYYYSNQNAVLMMANNEWRDHHQIEEILVIMTKGDLEPSSIFVSALLGWSIDYDYIMTNQIMFTFRRENGYMFNNSTDE